jgi:hypothetical protein
MYMPVHNMQNIFLKKYTCDYVCMCATEGGFIAGTPCSCVSDHSHM